MPSDAAPFLQDPFWYKDAVIYELHVRSFYDSNNDGYGDFEGMRQKLPYLERLGVNTLWLLPFLESPLRDDGYDTADYYSILPVHGTLDNFKAFIEDAHGRGMRVITELVLNHTSDQHPWFQEARDPGSDKHDWYVWSDTTEKYADARIIFTDTEVSNWTWDQQAQRYYWHRFFSHQPDLNYDNPDVRAAMKEVMFFWLDMVDGLRLDAVPYLYEREGTNCENLPETIGYIVELRKSIEERYGPGKILLAEANQWPEDTLPYFANGDGVQMAFNFPIMPRMYMALRRENRRPLVQMLQLTEDIPEDAQWALFLRNHDELTLEMVTDEERDYMYHEYAADPRFRINVGIRRRLTPLLGAERRRIELMNALLLSLKGSPILYYGDEIGMGDDPFLGDRNGVRTPMQWSPDKHGGFSRAPHHRLFMPAIDRGPYSYEFVNVEDAEQDPHSLLHFTRRLIALRKQHAQVFGRGSFEVLPVENQSVLAFVRAYEGERILVVANLSRYAQSAFLPPDIGLEGSVPVEMISQGLFPPIGDAPYHLILAPHGFYWFALESQESIKARQGAMPLTAAAGTNGELPVFHVREGLQNLVVRSMSHSGDIERLEEVLPGYLRRQRWFGAKERTIARVEVADAVRLQARPSAMYLSILNVRYNDGEDDLYVLPLAEAEGEAADAVLEGHPSAAVGWISQTDDDAHRLVYDGTASPAFWVALFNWWRKGGRGRSLQGLYAGEVFSAIRETKAHDARPLTGEQSNSAAIVDDRFFVKLYRRLERGINPETELLRHLTDVGFEFIPSLYGTVSFTRSGDQYVLGVLQEALPVESDGWTYALDAMRTFLDRVEGLAPPSDAPPAHYTDPVPPQLDDLGGEMLALARLLGVRTAEMHLALANAADSDLAPQPGTEEDTAALIERIAMEAEQTRALLRAHEDAFPQAPSDEAWERGMQRLQALSGVATTRQKIRIHGDYHLGQTLRASGEFYVLDFEGEPARSLEARRRRDYALRDVAGMLRSLEYAAYAAWQEAVASEDVEDEDLERWTTLLVRWCEAAFLASYFGTAESGEFLAPQEMRTPFLWASLLDKALYEVRYELNNRPSWTPLPLRGLTRLLEEALESEAKPSA